MPCPLDNARSYGHIADVASYKDEPTVNGQFLSDSVQHPLQFN